MVITEKPRLKEDRITKEMMKNLAYQSKSGRGVGRIEASEGKVERVREEERMPYRTEIRLCIERARLITEGYKMAEDDPIILKRAKALAHYLDNRTLYILPHQRIVGNSASKPCSLITFPEKWSNWLEKAIDGEYQMLLPDEKDRQELHEIHKYWRNKSVHGMERRLLPKEILEYWFYPNQGVFLWLHGGHVGTPNYEKIFKVGLKEIVEETKTKLEEISSDPELYLHARDYLKKKAFYEGVIIITEAVINQGKRFSQLCQQEAAEEKDEKRKAELEEMARICDWVPENPPRNLHEALQSFWFVNLVARVLDLQTSGNGERIDQIFYPFYKKDKEEGRLTYDEAEELVEHLMLMFNEEGALIPPSQPKAGPLITRVTTIGGVTREGSDATNEMTYIFMDASSSDTPFIDIVLRNSATYSDVTTKVRVGNLDGIVDTDFGISPSGFGLYTDNVFLKGSIVTSTGAGQRITINEFEDGVFNNALIFYDGAGERLRIDDNVFASRAGITMSDGGIIYIVDTGGGAGGNTNFIDIREDYVHIKSFMGVGAGFDGFEGAAINGYGYMVDNKDFLLVDINFALLEIINRARVTDGKSCQFAISCKILISDFQCNIVYPCSAAAMSLISNRISKFSFSRNHRNFTDLPTVIREENPYNYSTTKPPNLS